MVDHIVDASGRRGGVDIRVGVGRRRRWRAEDKGSMCKWVDDPSENSCLLVQDWQRQLEHGTSDCGRDRRGVGSASLMSAVVGLLIASAKGSFDLRDAEYRHSCANIILLDRAMAHYGPETKVGRDLLRQFAENRLRAVWPEDCRQRAHIECAPMEVDREAMQDVLRALAPKHDAQRWLQSRALQISTDIEQLHWLLIEQSGSTIQWPFLAILVFWLTMIFISFGLSAPPNATVITTLLVCSLSISGAIYLILQLHQPFDWPMKLSSAPLRTAIDQLGR